MKNRLFILVLLSILGMRGIYAQVNLDSGLVAKYPFNGNANDESGKANNGIVYGATLVTDRFGNDNSAYYFNGVSDFIWVDNNNSLNIPANISLCAWFQTSDPGDEAGGMLIAKMHTLNSRQYYLVAGDSASTNGDSLCFCLIKSDDNYIRPAIHSIYFDNVWHFMVGTYDRDSGDMKIYIDKKLKLTKHVGQFDLEQSTIPLTIGCYHGLYAGYRSYFRGNLDDIRIYNRALNASEIDALCDYVSNVEPVNIFSDSFHISPNPVSSCFKIETNNILASNIAITNAIGCIVMKSSYKSVFNISMLPPGIYFLRILDSQGHLLNTQKVIKE